MRPPILESDLVGKRFAVVYQGKRNAVLYIAKVERRFLSDEEGTVDKFLMICLKPKVGNYFGRHPKAFTTRGGNV